MRTPTVTEIRSEGQARLTLAALERSPLATAKRRYKPGHHVWELRNAAQRGQHGFWRSDLPTL